MNIKEYFKYDNGSLVCKSFFSRRVRVGDKLGGGSGHSHGRFNGISKQISHWVFYFFNDRFPVDVVFVDGDITNTRIENIVEVTSAKPMSKEWARFYFEYKNGELVRRFARRSYRAGSYAGTITSNGYLAVTVSKKVYLVHRVVWAYFNGDTEFMIDHKNGNKLDNRIENLREATSQQNNRNRKNAKGVTYVKKSKKWQAQICVSGKAIYLGTYSNKKDALSARRNAELKYFNEFAK